ncbi:MAG: hypothetical protein AAFP70_17320, partial [Calditrichota bacterium]
WNSRAIKNKLRVFRMFIGCASSRYVLVRGNGSTVNKKLKSRHIGTNITIFLSSGTEHSGELNSFDEEFIYLAGDYSQPERRFPVGDIDKIRLERINEDKRAVWVFIAVPLAIIFLSWSTVAAFD